MRKIFYKISVSDELVVFSSEFDFQLRKNGEKEAAMCISKAFFLREVADWLWKTSQAQLCCVP